MSAEPRISIAMATYNGARYIREQLDSLATQTLLPCELVVTDDGSTDATLEIIRDFAQEAPFPVRIHRNEKRLGFGDNFLRAASLCEGEFIAFCDQDDVWLPEKLARCVISFDRPSVLACLHSAETFDENRNLRGRRFPDYQSYTRHATCDNPWDLSYPGFAMIFRRDLTELFLPIARRISPRLEFCFGAHDLFVNFIAANFGDTVFLSDVLAWYRQHEANTCGAPQILDTQGEIIKSFNTSVTQYIGMSHIAAEREAVISACSSEFQRCYGANTEYSAARYRRLHSALTQRVKRYEARAPFAAMPSILNAILHGDYGRKSKGGLGGRAIIKDFLHAVVPGLLSSTKNRRTSYEK